MFLRQAISLAIIFLSCGVSSAFAQYGYSHRNIEITPFGGSRFGGVIDLNTTPIDFLTIKSTWDYGVMGDVDVWPNVQAEFMWNRQPTRLGAHNIDTGQVSPVGDATLDMYQWSILFALRQPEAKLKPYFVSGLGFTHFDTNNALNFNYRFSYNFGGGVKYFFSRHVGLRLEARYSPSRTTSSNVLICDPFFGCFPARVANYARQGQANLGLIVRF
jgi:opacity protein-like surface antigen